MRTVCVENGFAVVEKAAGEVCESTPEKNGIPDLLSEQTGNAVYTVHRLDAPTVGLAVFALDEKAAADLSRQLTDGSLTKEYRAVLEGTPENRSGRLDDLLFRDRTKNKTYVVSRERKGVRRAALEYEVEETSEYGGTPVFLARIKLLTGRTHQIRAQFSSRRHPVAGDARYGSKIKVPLALQSAFLSFNDPVTGERRNFSLAIPSGEVWSVFDTEK